MASPIDIWRRLNTSAPPQTLNSPKISHNQLAATSNLTGSVWQSGPGVAPGTLGFPSITIA
jgi:hypothetical protein